MSRQIRDTTVKDLTLDDLSRILPLYAARALSRAATIQRRSVCRLRAAFASHVSQ